MGMETTSTQTTTGPLDGWLHEPSDPSVGIFADSWYHDACQASDEMREAAATITCAGHVGSGVDRYQIVTTTLVCMDCGQATAFVERDWDPEEPQPPTAAEILAAPLRTVFDTGEGMALIVVQRHWDDLTLQVEDLAHTPADVVTLTSDGRSYSREGCHQGPEADWVFVERYTADGRVFHGFIDSVSRKLIQAG